MDNCIISVAMTTYNGSKYVEKQMASILAQTRMPDEVFILDDRSTDDTSIVVKNFIRSNNLDNKWHFIVNDKQLGWKANFFKAASLTTGDIVFFADQDDVWFDDKIEVMSSLMMKEKMGCLSGLNRVIDQEGNIVEQRMERPNYSGNAFKVQLKPSFYSYVKLGCCMCASRKIIDYYLRIGADDVSHDAQVARIALFFDSNWILDRPVIDYRMHISNTSGIDIKKSFGASSLDKRIDNLNEDYSLLDKIGKTIELTQEQSVFIENCKHAVRVRLDYLTGKGSNIFSLIKLRKYYSNLTQFLGDISYKHGVNDFLGNIRWRISKHY